MYKEKNSGFPAFDDVKQAQFCYLCDDSDVKSKHIADFIAHGKTRHEPIYYFYSAVGVNPNKAYSGPEMVALNDPAIHRVCVNKKGIELINTPLLTTNSTGDGTEKIRIIMDLGDCINSPECYAAYTTFLQQLNKGALANKALLFSIYCMETAKGAVIQELTQYCHSLLVNGKVLKNPAFQPL